MAAWASRRWRSPYRRMRGPIIRQNSSSASRSHVAGIASRQSGHMRAGIPFDLAQIIFLPLFAQYMLDNPGTSVEVLSISGHRNLFSESLDIAIWVGHQLRLPDSSFWSRWIGTFGRRL